MRTGVFFHPLFSKKAWPIIGNKYSRFPELLQDLLKLPRVIKILLREKKRKPEE